jgi:hypothetical protein
MPPGPYPQSEANANTKAAWLQCTFLLTETPAMARASRERAK